MEISATVLRVQSQKVANPNPLYFKLLNTFSIRASTGNISGEESQRVLAINQQVMAYLIALQISAINRFAKMRNPDGRSVTPDITVETFSLDNLKTGFNNLFGLNQDEDPAVTALKAKYSQELIKNFLQSAYYKDKLAEANAPVYGSELGFGLPNITGLLPGVSGISGALPGVSGVLPGVLPGVTRLL